MATKTATKKTTSKATAQRKVEFALSGVTASEVLLVGDFTEWQTAPVALKKSKQGVWSVKLPLAPGRYEYRYLADGQWYDDPNSASRVDNPFGTQNALMVVE